MNTKKIALIAIFVFSIIFLAIGIGVYFMPLSYITINDVRQVATPENTRVFRLIFFLAFGGIGLISSIAGIVLATKWKRA